MAKPLRLRTDAELETRDDLMAKIKSLRDRRMKLADTSARDWRAHESKIRSLYEREMDLCGRVSRMDRETGRKLTEEPLPLLPVKKIDWTAYGRNMAEGETLLIPSDIAEPIVDRLIASGGEFRIQSLKGRVFVLKCGLCADSNKSPRIAPGA